MNPNTNTFGDRLRELRKSRGLQQSELGRIFELSPSAIGSYERGLREPAFKHLIGFANYFKVSTDYILGNTEERVTLDDYIKSGNTDFFDILNKSNLSINGYELTEEDKRRLGDIVVGLFWTKMSNVDYK